MERRINICLVLFESIIRMPRGKARRAKRKINERASWYPLWYHMSQTFKSQAISHFIIGHPSVAKLRPQNTCCHHSEASIASDVSIMILTYFLIGNDFPLYVPLLTDQIDNSDIEITFWVHIARLVTLTNWLKNRRRNLQRVNEFVWPIELIDEN
jgi:hypothetical protein